jgi:hypothetical protein
MVLSDEEVRYMNRETFSVPSKLKKHFLFLGQPLPIRVYRGIQDIFVTRSLECYKIISTALRNGVAAKSIVRQSILFHTESL